MQRITDSPYFQRFWTWAGSFSIRVKVLGIVLAVVVLLGMLVTINIRNVLSVTLGQELSVQGHALAETFAQQIDGLLLEDDPQGLQFFLAALREHYSSEGHNTDVAWLMVTAADGTIVARDPEAEGAFAEDAVIEIAHPVPNSDEQIVIGLNTSEIRIVVNQVTLDLLVIILIMILIGFLGAALLTWILTRPIYALVAATQAVAKGDFSPRVPRWADDEIGELSEAFNRMTSSLEEAERARADREQLRAQFVSRVILAQEDERKRIARELHDSTGQSLTSLLVGLQNLRAHSTESQFNSRIDELRAVVSHTLEEVRAISWQLRPAVLDDLGLISAIERYISDFRQRYQISVDFATNERHMRLPDELETTIYRIIQEGLTNIARHSQASNASVMIDMRASALRIIVEDDGIGFDAGAAQRKQHLGLQGIRERATLFDGTLTIESNPGSGTSLFIEMPLNAG